MANQTLPIEEQTSEALALVKMLQAKGLAPQDQICVLRSAADLITNNIAAEAFAQSLFNALKR